MFFLALSKICFQDSSFKTIFLLKNLEADPVLCFKIISKVSIFQICGIKYKYSRRMTAGKGCIFFYIQTWQSTERHHTERVLRDAVSTYPTSCYSLKTYVFSLSVIKNLFQNLFAELVRNNLLIPVYSQCITLAYTKKLLPLEVFPPHAEPINHLHSSHHHSLCH